jgi:hypothetical protein
VDISVKSPVAQWLERSRGKQTQESLAADITAVTGWRLTRDRYSRYESGSLPIGPKVLGHFRAYWATRGIEFDTTPPAPPVDPVVAAIDRQTEKIDKLAEAISRLAEGQQASREPGREAEWLQAIPWDQVGEMLAAVVQTAVEARLNASGAEPRASNHLD